MAASGVVLRTFRFAPSLPRLTAWAPPAYGRGWPGSSGQHRLRPKHIRSIPPTPSAWAPPAYGRGWPGSSGQYRLRPKHIRSIPPTPCGVGPARLRPRVARVLQDNTACDPSTSAPSLPRLAARASPAYGRGWPGSSGQHRLRPCIHRAPSIRVPGKAPLCTEDGQKFF